MSVLGSEANVMPSCREVSRLIGSGTYATSPLLHKALVRLHLLLCDECGRYAREIAALGPVARQAFGEPLDPGRLAALEQAILDRAAAPREGSTGDDS